MNVQIGKIYKQTRWINAAGHVNKLETPRYIFITNFGDLPMPGFDEPYFFYKILGYDTPDHYMYFRSAHLVLDEYQ